MKGDKYVGKSKNVWRHSKPDQLLIEFSDRITDKNGIVKSEVLGKGVVACQITRQLFSCLSAANISNHYLNEWKNDTLVVVETDPLPLEVVVRFIAAGSLLTRIPVHHGQKLQWPLVEFYYKNDEWNDPLISDRHVAVSGFCTKSEVDNIAITAERAAIVLSRRLAVGNVDLVDIKLEFGRALDGSIILIDEISPETFRAWDVTTKRSLDKDIFRNNLGSVTAAYETLLDRLVNSGSEL